MGQLGRTTTGRKTGAIGLLVLAGLLSGLQPAPARPRRAEAVVVARPGRLAAAESAARTDGARITSELKSLNAFDALIDSDDLGSLAANPAVASATPDGALNLVSDSAGYDPAQDAYSLASIETSTGVRSLWADETGAGVGVALIDSGVDPIPGYLDLVVQGPNFSTSRRPFDGFGHGTFMAGIIAGDQAGADPVANASNAEDYFGVAPSSTLVSIKVADSQGNTSLSQILAGINWVINNRSRYNLRVINLSFGAMPQDAYVVDPLAWSVERAWQAGIVVVVSAGNDGSTSNGLENPAYGPFVIAVGAEDTGAKGVAASVAPFSSWGDGVRDPDLVAPGAHIESLTAPDSSIADNYASTGGIDGTFFRGSGTSESAAFTTGMAALLIQEHPTFTPDQIKALMVSTSSPLAKADRRAEGAGALQPRTAAGPISDALASVLARPQSFAHALPSASESTTSSPACPLPSNLHGRNLLGADLPGADLRSRALGGANTQAAELGGSSMLGPNLQGADLQGAVTAGASSGADDPTARLLESVAPAVGSSPVGQACASTGTRRRWGGSVSSWSGSSWSGSSWSGSSWSGSSWSGSSWSTASWS